MNLVSKENKHITVFEHETLRFDKGEKKITENQLKALQVYHGEKGVPFYSLCYNGVKFNEHVGVLQVGNTVIEVLPKADKNPASKNDENKWRKLLIGMLKAVGSFDIKSTSSSNLKIRPNTILDLYFEMFIKEVELLLHGGLVKKYRKKEENAKFLKGSLQFGKQMQQNLIHKERFYVRHTTYDVKHQLHFILYKTLRLLKQINTKATLSSRIGALLLNFPEMPEIGVNEATFKKLVFDRKTEAYKKAIEIARLILLQYHPDLSRGQNYVLALMFDMNKLWEQFVYLSLRKQLRKEMNITAQTSKFFWKPKEGYRTKMRPDIVITDKQNGNCIVLDTKWKNLYNSSPLAGDLRQMYVYNEYYEANKVALVYPGTEMSVNGGVYLDPITSKETGKECSIISIAVEDDVKKWQNEICKSVMEWFKLGY